MTRQVGAPTSVGSRLDTTQRDYAGAANFYDDTRRASPSLVAAMLEQLGPPNGRTLLEVGCGTGNYAAAFAEAGFRVIALDPSREMLARAAAKLPGQVTRAVGESLPLPDRSIDCTVTVNVFHHLRDPRLLLGEFARVTRDRTLHHLTAHGQFRAHWAMHYFPLLRHERPGEHPRRATLVRLLRRAGFVDIDPVRFDYRDTADASLMPLRSASPWRLRDGEYRMGISAFRRLTLAEDASGEAALAADLASGRFAEVRRGYDAAWSSVGDSLILVAKPAPSLR